MRADADLSELLGSPESMPTVSPDAVTGAPVVVATGAPSSKPGGVAYDGSEKFDQFKLWSPPIRSADADLLPEKSSLDARARDTMRNDAYVAGGASIHKDNIVGAQYLLNSKPKTKVLWGKEDDQWEREFQEEVETKFTLWAESPNNWIDASRTNTLTSLVRLAVGVHTAGGEVLAAGEWMPNDGRPFRTAIQMIDTDRLSTPWDLKFRRDIRGGVERDSRGAPKAYHIRMAHPSDIQFNNDFNQAYKWKRVAARKPWGRQMILHIFEQQRVDQSRGVAAMVTALKEMRMTKKFRDVELQSAVLAATYAASIESDLPTGDVYAAMGTDDNNPAMSWVNSYLSAIAEYSGGAKNLHIDGAKIPVFMPGTKLRIQNTSGSGPLGDRFEQSLLRHIAASLGVSYEQLSKDYTKTNYSSAKASMGETWKAMQSRKKIVGDGTANFIYRLWLEEAINHNQIESLKRTNVPLFYDGLNADAYTACEWIGAGQGMIDPLKETQADVLAIKNGLDTKERVIARRIGGDWRLIATQRSRELDLDQSYKLPSIHEDPNSTDMLNSLSGTPQERKA